MKNVKIATSTKIAFACALVIQGSQAVAGLDGRQRQSVYDSTNKSCLASSAHSAPQSSLSERHAWCKCYAAQVVDNVNPADIKEFRAASGPSSRMKVVAGNAGTYCRSKLY